MINIILNENIIDIILRGILLIFVIYIFRRHIIFYKLQMLVSIAIGSFFIHFFSGILLWDTNYIDNKYDYIMIAVSIIFKIISYVLLYIIGLNIKLKIDERAGDG